MTILAATTLEAIVSEMRRDIEGALERKISQRVDRFFLKRALSGGKRLRPILLLMVFKAMGGKDYEKALDVAAALEIAHSASLVHDDILDIDYRRRGAPSLWRQVGVGKALLEGHRMINLAFSTVLEKGLEIAKVFVEAWDKASKGILDEVISQFNPSSGLYILLIREKTASLFEAAAQAGCILAEADPQASEAMKKYGLELGTAYQLADDLNEIIKRTRQGRMAYLVAEIRQRFIRFLISSKTGRFDWMLRSISPKTPSADFLIGEIVKRIAIARSLTIHPCIPDTPYREFLRSLPLYFVTQILREGVEKG
ncbi:MAG: polyprenyl synthetase family protein [Nitrososphaerota archaeon]